MDVTELYTRLLADGIKLGITSNNGVGWNGELQPTMISLIKENKYALIALLKEIANPSYQAGWSKVFPAGRVLDNPPHWEKNGIRIPVDEG